MAGYCIYNPEKSPLFSSKSKPKWAGTVGEEARYHRLILAIGARAACMHLMSVSKGPASVPGKELLCALGIFRLELPQEEGTGGRLAGWLTGLGF